MTYCDECGNALRCGDRVGFHHRDELTTAWLSLLLSITEIIL